MKTRDAVSVSVKVLGLAWLYKGGYALAMGLASLGAYVVQVEGRGQPYGFLIIRWVAPVATLAAGYAAIRWSDWLAAKAVQDDGELPLPASGEWERSIFLLAMRVVGVACLAVGVPRVAASIANALIQHRFPNLLIGWAYGLPELAFGIAMIAFGFYLLAGGKHLVAFAFKERKAASGTGEGPAGQV